MVDHVGVHASHCCARHGCKYADASCPVRTGTIEQMYGCECGSLSSPCTGPIQVPEVVRQAALGAFWGATGYSLSDSALLTDEALMLAVAAALQAWEQVREG